MAVVGISSAISSNFLQKVSGRAGSTSTSSSSAFPTTADAIRVSLKNGARNMVTAVGNLNTAANFLNLTQDTLAKLDKVVSKIITIADRAAQAGTNSDQRKNLNDLFKKNVKDFKDIVSDAVNGERDTIDASDIKEILQAVGLDENTSGELGSFLSQFILDDREDLLASEYSIGKRPQPGTSSISYGEGTFSLSSSFVGNAVLLNDPLVGDYDEDGLPDIITAITATGNIFFNAGTRGTFLGNGDGTFESASGLEAGFGIFSLFQGDFNEDGHLDIIENRYSASNRRVFYYAGNGDGTFGALVTLATKYEGTNVVDANEDGHLDLIGADINGNLSTYLGNGDGTFQANATQAGPAAASNAVTGDFNGDGKVDVITSGGGFNDAFYFQGNGDGTFQAYVTIPTGITTGTGVLYVGDVNNDGKQDLLRGSEPGEASFSVLLGNGDGTFGTRYTSAFGADNVIRVADVDGDGNVDVFGYSNPSAGDYSVGVSYGNGDGTFRGVVTAQSQGIVGYSTLGSGDVDNDGFLDIIAVTGGEHFVFLQDSYYQPGGKYTNVNTVFPSERNILTRADAKGLAADARALKKSIEANLESVEKVRAFVGEATEFARQTGLALLSASNEVNSNFDAEKVAELVRSQITDRSGFSARVYSSLSGVVAKALLVEDE